MKLGSPTKEKIKKTVLLEIAREKSKREMNRQYLFLLSSISKKENKEKHGRMMI